MYLSHLSETHESAARQIPHGGTVVAPHEAAISAGMRMYERGGNAVDAAVATALVSGVIEPTETSLAGSGFLLVSLPDNQVVSVEFGPKAPQAVDASVFEIDQGEAHSPVLGLARVVNNANVDGPLASGVPRTLLGLLTAQQRFGTLSLATVLEPARELAREGFNADSWFLLNALSDVDRLRLDPGAAEVFLENALPRGAKRQGFYGKSIESQQAVPQVALANTLEVIAEEGLSALTTGTIAKQLMETAAEFKMLLTAEDFAESAPEIGVPDAIDYRGSRVFVPSAPNGGMTVLQILKIWESLFPVSAPQQGSPEYLRSLALVSRHAFADRYHWLGDPDYVPVPSEGLLSQQYCDALAAQIRAGQVPTEFSDGTIPWSHFAEQPLHTPPGAAEPSPWQPQGGTAPTSGTTHVSAADSSGYVVSITHTAANHFGSGIVCRRTGLLFDSSLAWFNAVPGAANSVRGGARPLANMSPVIVQDAQGNVTALGASGGRRIIGGVSQSIIALVDYGIAPIELPGRARLDASGPHTVIDQRLSSSAELLEDLSLQIIPRSKETFSLDFSRVNLASRQSDGAVVSSIDANAYDV